MQHVYQEFFCEPMSSEDCQGEFSSFFSQLNALVGFAEQRVLSLRGPQGCSLRCRGLSEVFWRCLLYERLRFGFLSCRWFLGTFRGQLKIHDSNWNITCVFFLVLADKGSRRKILGMYYNCSIGAANQPTFNQDKVRIIMSCKKPGKKAFGHDRPPKGYPKDQSAYADPENWRYPLHTPWHARAARRYFDDWSNRGKYTDEERAYIDSRIDHALKKFEAKASPNGKKRLIPKVPSVDKTEELSLRQLLQLFLGAARLKRAMEMSDSLVTIEKKDLDQVNGRVKEYLVRIDTHKRNILHDCQDWRKNMASKNMCKHLGKIILMMDQTKATELLRDILRNKDQWTFNAPETIDSTS